MAKASRKRFLKRLLAWIVAMFVLLVLVCAAADFYVGSFSKGRLYAEAADVPHRRAAVVLGCNKFAYGRLNLYYLYRIDAAVKLWEAGKIDAILISGDNSRIDYDEPGSMKADLVEKGIPAEYISLDYAGFRTLDSVVRAHAVFGLDDYIVVSQPFHCQRAIYLAGTNGKSVIGFCAQEPSGVLSTRVRLREVLARVNAVLDVLIKKEPKFLGQREEIVYRQSKEQTIVTPDSL